MASSALARNADTHSENSTSRTPNAPPMTGDKSACHEDATKKVRYMKENLGAYGVELTDEEDGLVKEGIARTEVHGTRVAAHLMGALVKDTPPQ
ncbi:hypothetical protein B0I37DRAFT_409895 [Chaetomium sp. MPI-CAGE-AT-0009]|nr:hypothetical protein B0I37DRAFT_409895 [Chaetomium sp. MPI-CAGE-AT-0009]